MSDIQEFSTITRSSVFLFLNLKWFYWKGWEMCIQLYNNSFISTIFLFIKLQQIVYYFVSHALKALMLWTKITLCFPSVQLKPTIRQHWPKKYFTTKILLPSMLEIFFIEPNSLIFWKIHTLISWVYFICS